MTLIGRSLAVRLLGMAVLTTLGAGAVATSADAASADAPAAASSGQATRRPAAPRVARTAASRPLTIRRRVARRAEPGPVDVVGDGFYGDDYLVRQHGWNDPRLYYFGPFRTGGDVFYGDQAGSPITRGNAGLGMIAGYGGARGGFGGPHFDSVGGFHNGPGPDRKIDDDYALGSLSRPDYGDVTPRYPSVKARVANLDQGPVPRSSAPDMSLERATGRKLTAEGRSNDASFEEAKARFAAPMRRSDPNEGLPGDQPLPTFGDLTGDF